MIGADFESAATRALMASALGPVYSAPGMWACVYIIFEPTWSMSGGLAGFCARSVLSSAGGMRWSVGMLRAVPDWECSAGAMRSASRVKSLRMVCL